MLFNRSRCYSFCKRPFLFRFKFRFLSVTVSHASAVILYPHSNRQESDLYVLALIRKTILTLKMSKCRGSYVQENLNDLNLGDPNGSYA